MIHSSFKINGYTFTNIHDVVKKKDLFHKELFAFIRLWLNDSPTITVHTSGTTGTPKPIQLSKKAMIASAKATGTLFNCRLGTKALLCLPLAFIAGKMMLVRAMILGWEIDTITPKKTIILNKTYDFVAMTPQQVYHSLETLPYIDTLLIGGAPIDSVLEEQLQQYNTKCYASYGMTETITHVALRKINGKIRSKAYTALPNVVFSLDKRDCSAS